MVSVDAPTIPCVDGAPAMVDLCRTVLSQPPHAAASRVDVSLMTGGELKFQDSGTAVLTTWADLGYVDVIRQAQKAVRPGMGEADLFHVPISAEWYKPEHSRLCA
ncbi:hypothetical protein K458DRAFT_430748 [Lentithecium fluviatile CBS 122367]|uniref:Uncharacterized protein n=1 Tax=Lentithecium fluviatile CBS 122367 TaxID=1168545 RepID=A0A6G1J440_9PLEO|nr:hypothetical protein K458DRAFT_430748 [Lentithecium fluviatile CBS 122367]